MATATASTTATRTIADPKPQTLPRNPRACFFSFAAYAKAVAGGLVGGGAAVDAGLSAAELAEIESSLGFSFPPDLRALLAEALPVSPGFPNWRSSPHLLLLLLRLPHADLLRAAAHGPLWPGSWGPRPDRPSDRADRARETLDRAPILVPIYRRYYVPASPALAGNPVFHVRGGEVRVAAADIAEFFGRWGGGFGGVAAAWGAGGEGARRVEVWTEMAEERTCGRGEAARAVERGLVEMGGRLREAGWGEEEVREMMRAGSDGGDGDEDEDEGGGFDRPAVVALRDRESVAWHVRLLALALRRAGWSSDDVAETMGCFGPSGGGGGGAAGPTRAVTWRADPAGDHISMDL